VIVDVARLKMTIPHFVAEEVANHAWATLKRQLSPPCMGPIGGFGVGWKVRPTRGSCSPNHCRGPPSAIFTSNNYNHPKGQRSVFWFLPTR